MKLSENSSNNFKFAILSMKYQNLVVIFWIKFYENLEFNFK